MSLQDLLEKCKSEKVFTSLIIILVGIGCFGLGRLSKIESQRQGISIEAPAQVATALKAENQTVQSKVDPSSALNDTSLNNDNGQNSVGQVVASKNGTKYHFPWCSGAKTISPANKITFNSIEEARTAGYTPAANCPGLK